MQITLINNRWSSKAPLISNNLETEPSISAKNYQHNHINALRSYGITELHSLSDISAEALFPVVHMFRKKNMHSEVHCSLCPMAT